MRPRQLKLVLPIFSCLVLYFYNSHAQDSQNEKQTIVALRMIGHQVLLASNDSTSRVLPIIKENNYYRIRFDSEFEIQPTELVSLVESVITETNLASSYIVEVQQCDTKEVVYSFQMSDLEQSDIIPCSGRMQPKGCYSLLFTMLKTNEADMALPNDIADSKNESEEGISSLNYGIIGVLLMLIAGVFFFLWKRKNTPKSNPNLIPLGEFHFDKRNTALLINHQKIELTSKEADLLLLLYNTVNITVERAVILNKVWGDQGDYVGRTLDVFISKLRKKLEADTSVKITNIRGVGYKLVMEI